MSRKEAARTSVCSRRWRYLWLFSSGPLELDDRTVFSAIGFDKFRRKKFIAWVNRVLKLHKVMGLDSLIIRYDYKLLRYTSRRPGYIDSWIYFALQKEVKMLELNFGHDNFFLSRYEFPNVDMLFSRSHDAKFGFGSLRSLRLVGIDIKDEVVEYFLASCPYLEQLCIRGSKATKNLHVVDPLPNLKVLEICECFFIRSLEISAMNLVSCTYEGRKITLPFKEIPNLSELTLGGNFSQYFIDERDVHSGYSAQLVKLALNIPIVSYGNRYRWRSCEFCDLHRLCSLKHLELNVTSPVGRSLHFFTSLIKASPLLIKFSIKMSYMRADPWSRKFGFPEVDHTFVSYRCCHKNLKTMKMSGYVGCSRHDKFVLRLLKIAPSLDTVTIDTESEYYDQKPWICTTGTKCAKGRDPLCICTTQGTGARTRIEAKQRAQQLKFKFPPNTKALFIVT